MNNLKYAVEGILFAAGEPVKTAKLAIALETDTKSINKAVEELKDEYNKARRGFAIIDIDEDKEIIFLVVSRREVALVQRKLKSIDPRAFFVVTDAYDTYGEGFKEFPEADSVLNE